MRAVVSHRRAKDKLIKSRDERKILREKSRERRLNESRDEEGVK